MKTDKQLTREQLTDLQQALADYNGGGAAAENLNGLLWAFSDELIAAAEIGVKWHEDSALETWFPYTARTLAELRGDNGLYQGRIQSLKRELKAADIWLKVWLAFTTSSNSTSAKLAAEWADMCLKDFKKRWPELLEVKP